MEPKTHVFGSRSFRPDFVAGIFNGGIDALQMRERLSQCRHVRQVKRHVIDRFWRRFTFEQRNCHVVVAHRDSIVDIEFFAQPQRALEPLRALLRITHSQTEVTNLSEHEWNLHEGIEFLSFGLRWFGAVSRNERLHEMPVEICQGVARRFPQSAGAPPHFWADKCQPDVADHSHSWAQTCSRGARMIFEIVLDILLDRKSTRLNSSHTVLSRMPS